MAITKVRENESIDEALKRFKRKISKEGVFSELKRRTHHESKSRKRKIKQQNARKKTVR